MTCDPLPSAPRLGRSLFGSLALLFLLACGHPADLAVNDATASKYTDSLAAALSDKDFIFVSIDTLRADHLPFYGYKRQTSGAAEDPFSLSWLAQRGQVWQECWAPIGKTLPSLGTFWTGLHPLEHGGIANTTPLQAPSRARRFRAAGFKTLALVANRTLGAKMNLADGFSEYGVAFGAKESLIPRALLDKTKPVINSQQRLMLWAHFMAPHQPYDPAPAFAKHYLAAGDSVLPIGSNELLQAYNADPESLTAAAKQHQIDLYDAEILAATAWVQELLAGLDASYRAAGRGGLLDNAVVVFFADHGEELAQRHGYFMHAKSLYSDVLQVPLVIAGKGMTPGVKSTAIGLGEVLPLVMDGTPPHGGPFFSSWQTEYYGYRDSRWTMLHNPGQNSMGPLEPPDDVPYLYPAVSLFDRQADPGEKHNVAAQHPDEVRRILRELDAWYRGLERRPPQFLPGQDPALRLKQLVELGYLDQVPDTVCPPWASLDQSH